MPPPNVQPEFGIRWVPTILGASLIIAGFVVFGAGLPAPSKHSVDLILGFVFVVFGIALVRFGRRGISQSLRSTDRIQKKGT